MTRFQTSIMIIVVSCLFLVGENRSHASEPYVFGYQTDLTGDARASYAPIAEGFRLFINALNDKGGVNGHPIKVIYEDDKSRPDLAGSIAEKLITKDDVLAILGLGYSRSQPPVLELAGKSGIPVLTGYTATTPLFPDNPTKNVFSVGVQMHPKAMPQGYSNAYVASKICPAGRVAVTSFDTPGGRLCNDWSEAWCKKLGMQVVFKSEWPPATLNYTPWLMKVRKAKPDMLISTVGGANYIPLLRQMEKFQLETLDLLVVDFVNEGDLVKGIEQLLIGTGDNVIWLSRYASALDPERPPEFENIQKAMNKYSHRYSLSALHAMGWTMARVVESALKKAGWPSTRDDFMAALEKTDLDTKGLTGGPIRFSPTDHYGPTWWKAYRWDGKTKVLKTTVDWYKVELQDIMGKI